MDLSIQPNSILHPLRYLAGGHDLTDVCIWGGMFVTHRLGFSLIGYATVEFEGLCICSQKGMDSVPRQEKQATYAQSTSRPY
jgi:hypothetical protein